MEPIQFFRPPKSSLQYQMKESENYIYIQHTIQKLYAKTVSIKNIAKI